MTTEATKTTAGSSPVERHVRRAHWIADRRIVLSKRVALPETNKTMHLLAHLEETPMLRKDAAAYLGNKQFQKLVRAGAVTQFTDVNPDYANSTRGQRAMCEWVTRGDAEFKTRARAASTGNYSPTTVRWAVNVLRKLGYTVTDPSA